MFSVRFGIGLPNVIGPHTVCSQNRPSDEPSTDLHLLLIFIIAIFIIIIISIIILLIITIIIVTYVPSAASTAVPALPASACA